MDYVPLIIWCVWVFLLGLGIGSFLNVLIARLPYEKSPIWPGSRCGNCLRSLRMLDNLPIVGYLRLRGKCRFCGARFSSRYMWVELGTGLAFVVLFLVEIAMQARGGPDFLKPWQATPGLEFPYLQSAIPPWKPVVYFLVHACLLSLLIASAVVDLEHQIIPPQLTYIGTAIALVASVLLPWPWPTSPEVLQGLPADREWLLPEVRVPTGLMLWPFAKPPEWAPAGSTVLGLVNALVGAAVGMLVGRGVKFLFEVGLDKEALGLGDADLLMMIGAFLGWQIAVLAMPIGALLTLPIVLPVKAWSWIRGKESSTALPFGPGIAAGAVAAWFGWPILSEFARVFFDPFLIVVITIIMAGGMLVAGLILRRGEPAPATTP